MQTEPPRPVHTARNVVFVLVGVGVLILKHSYRGPLSAIFASYAGNVAVSFSVYFLVLIAVSRWTYGRILAAVLALAAVELFEITNGFGIMSNVYDQFDLLANALGVGLAIAVDLGSERLLDVRGN